jgi:hypothetical protein
MMAMMAAAMQARMKLRMMCLPNLGNLVKAKI